MIRKLFASALFAGLAAGVLAALLQFQFVVPLLFEGELYETGEVRHFVADDILDVQSPAGPPPIGGDLQRHVGTLAMTLVTYTGFALLMVVGFAVAETRGHRLTVRTGALWGLCGFVAVQLAPAAGLPPELPGTIGADLAARQLWWVATVAASVAALALIAFGGAWLALAGAALLLAPHLVGAPHLDTYYGVAPPELAAHFATSSLAVAAASWVALGAAAGYFWTREA